MTWANWVFFGGGMAGVLIAAGVLWWARGAILRAHQDGHREGLAEASQVFKDDADSAKEQARLRAEFKEQLAEETAKLEEAPTMEDVQRVADELFRGKDESK